MKKERKSLGVFSILGGGIGGIIASLLLISAYIYSTFFESFDPNSWVNISFYFIVQWIMAYPMQLIFNLILGEDNFVERFLLFPTAFLSFILIGLLLGWIVGKVKLGKN